MNESRSSSRRRLSRLRLLSPFLLVAGLLLGGFAVRSGATPAVAIAPCVAHTNTADEVALLGMVQSWRAQNVPGAASTTLTLTPSLNQAAMGYAQYLAQNGGGGHFADGSAPWDRAQQCGFETNSSGQAAGGEAYGRGATPADGLNHMIQVVALEGSGAGLMTAAVKGGNIPVHCAGVASATTADGTKTHWIVLLFAREGACPGAISAGEPTSTATPTPSDRDFDADIYLDGNGRDFHTGQHDDRNRYCDSDGHEHLGPDRYLIRDGYSDGSANGNAIPDRHSGAGELWVYAHVLRRLESHYAARGSARRHPRYRDRVLLGALPAGRCWLGAVRSRGACVRELDELVERRCVLAPEHRCLYGRRYLGGVGRQACGIVGDDRGRSKREQHLEQRPRDLWPPVADRPRGQTDILFGQ